MWWQEGNWLSKLKGLASSAVRPPLDVKLLYYFGSCRCGRERCIWSMQGIASIYHRPGLSHHQHNTGDRISQVISLCSTGTELDTSGFLRWFVGLLYPIGQIPRATLCWSGIVGPKLKAACLTSRSIIMHQRSNKSEAKGRTEVFILHTGIC